MSSNPLYRYSATCQTRGLRKEAEKEEKTAKVPNVFDVID